MYDAVFLATIVAFFALCVAYVRACDRIIGSDDEVEFDADNVGTGEPTEPEERAA